MSEEIDQKTCVKEESLEQMIRVQTEAAKEYCSECIHVEVCCWYPFQGCAFRESIGSDQMVGRWIPIAETLPGDERMKLVTCMPFGGGVRCIDSARYINGHWHGSRPIHGMNYDCSKKFIPHKQYPFGGVKISINSTASSFKECGYINTY